MTGDLIEGKIFAFDIDDTIAVNGRVKEGVNALFRHIHSKNHPIVLVTKRTKHASQVIINQLTTKVDLVSFGGMLVTDSDQRNLWASNESLDVMRLMQSQGNFKVILEGADGWTSTDNGILPLARMILGLPLEERIRWGQDFPVYRAIIKGRLEPDTCYQIFGDQINIDYWPTFTLTEIQTKSENKSIGLRVYSRIVGISDIMAVGDDFHDISMFEMANESIAFLASPAEVRAAASVVVNHFSEAVTYIYELVGQ